MLLRARIVLPVTQPPLENGAVEIRNGLITAVGRWEDLRARAPAEEVVDLGEAILLPGLVNAHCHLDYTQMAGMIYPPRTFPDWIKSILALKAGWDYSDYAASWIEGAKMLWQTGTMTVADIEAVPELLPDVWSATPLRVLSFLELTSVKSSRAAQDILAEAGGRIALLSHPSNRVHLSPHALYSTTPELVRAAAAHSRERSWPMSTHVAESDPEMAMFQSRTGPLYDWLKNQRNNEDCGGLSPVGQLHALGALWPGFQAVHVNYLAPDDARLLSENRCSVVHCPRSHAYFNHAPFPYGHLARQGVNVCLGTDSLASVLTGRMRKPELSLFAEMQRFNETHPQVAPEEVLKMATLAGARSLGLEEQIGSLSPGKLGDMIGLDYSGPVRDAAAALLKAENRPRIICQNGNLHRL